MNKKIKAMWIAALLSGEYKQGQGCLRDGDEFCCLGVLCDLHRKEGLGEWDGNDNYLEESSILPDAVSQWAGLSDNEDPNNPIVGRGGDGAPCLAECNDGFPGNKIRPMLNAMPFKKIASLIGKSL